MPDDTRFVITHVDFKPPFAEQGEALMRTHAEALRQASGFVRCDVVQLASRANHFELLTVWDSTETYEAHLSLDETVAFRAVVHPFLGSPWDDQIHLRLASVEAD